MTATDTEMAERAARVIMGQRDEIARAFVAKYGFEPDRAIQIEERTATGFRWSIHRMSDEEWAVRQALAVRIGQSTRLEYREDGSNGKG